MHQLLGNELGRENFDFPGTWRLLQLTPKPIDIIHCHNLHGRFFDLRVLPWLSHQVPLILNLRDAWLLSGHCAHSFTCDRWKTGCGQCPDLSIHPPIKRDATAFNWRRKRDIYSRSRLYIAANSHWLMGRVKDSMLKGCLYRVIPNGIDLNVFRPGDKAIARTKLGLPTTAKIVLYAANGGTKSRWRNFPLFQNALRQTFTGNGDELILICLGELNDRPEQKLGRVHIQYQRFERNPKNMALYYQAADIYALPALVEASGKTITEAMACGTPVVATSVGGIPEQAVTGKTAFLVRPLDFEGMAKAVQRLLSDEYLRREMGSAAAEHAVRFFSLERQVDAFLNWYEEVRQDWMDWHRKGGPNPGSLF